MKELIKSSIQKFSATDFTANALEFFKILGYDTSITIAQTEKTYQNFKENFVDLSENKAHFNEYKAITTDWKSFDFLFQLADNLSGIKGGKVNNQEVNSVVFACIELSGTSYSRTQLAEITRQVNVIFAMPVVVLFKYKSCITLSIIHRRINKKDEQRDVLEKVSLIKDIFIENPHRAQIEILHDFAFPNLANKKNPNNFVALINAWETVFSTKTLNKQFFKKIANWYFLSVAKSQFPYEYLKNDRKNADKTNDQLQTIANQKATIRFITRMIFVWFLKEKGLISNALFDKKEIDKILKKDKSNSSYYNAILQNLFFATLNKASEHREFATDNGFHKNKATYDVNSLYRYEKMFVDESAENVMKLFEKIPFLNGGLFDSLDNKENDDIIDGFSRNPNWQAKMPDFLFFQEQEIDFDNELRTIYDAKKGHFEVKGLFAIFNEYKFTIEENTPTEIDVALDPYLLGEIFENLLAYYNPETGTTARKGSGSFYTPQEFVNYMVDESLNAYLATKLGENFVNVSNLYTADTLTLNQRTAIVKALSDLKILDPACGSGAFPMGVLYKMVDILKTIDPDNSIWKQIQHDKIIGEAIAKLKKDEKIIEGLNDNQVKEKALKAVAEELQQLEANFDNKYNFDDYTRKLYIIQNCIYGVDIQDVAIQISKLRFFLSLIVDQKNEDIKPLPNLETKFVIANTLIGIDLPKFTVMGEDDHSQDTTKALKEELKNVREQHFKAVTRKEKQVIKAKDKAIREKIANSLADSMSSYKQKDIDKLNEEMATQKRFLAEAELMPDMVQEIIVTDLFGGESTQKVNYRKERIKECNAQIRLIESKIASLQTNTQAEQIRTQALKIAQWDIYNQNATADWFDMDWMFGITDGFDIVIGNPPYVQLQKDGGKLANLYANKGYKTFERTGDIYSLFYEQGINMLKEKGNLNYITSNKWMRANYGESLRDFFIKHNPLKLIDLGSGVFENATVDTNIIIVTKEKNKNHCLALDLTKVKSINSFEQFSDQWTSISNLTKDSWAILSGTENTIKQKIEKIGKPLKDWDIQINYGIKTGFNEAFIIDTATKERLCAEDPKSVEIIKPILRGKDINKYKANWAGLWLIVTHNGYKEDNKHIQRIVVENYPAIKNYLDQYLPQLSVRGDKGETPYNLRNCAYMGDFEKEKIVFQEIVQESNFCFEKKFVFCVDTGRIITGNNLQYLITFMNSKLFFHCVKNYYGGGGLGEKGIRMKHTFFEQIPIPEITETSQQPFIKLVDKILDHKKLGKDTSALEHQIDVMVYHLYELSYNEACVIDASLSQEDFEKYKL